MAPDVPRATAAAVTMAVDQTTAKVSARLTEAGIDHLLLKGPTFSWFWPADVMRPYGDSDILVPPDRFDDAAAVLVEAGFTRRAGIVQVKHADTYDRADWGQTVDLHHAIPGITASDDDTWAALRAHAVPYAVNGRQVLGLDAVGAALHVALHAAQTVARYDKPEEDLRLLLARPDTPWREAAALARTLGAAEAMRYGLERGDGGSAIADQLGLPSGTALGRASTARGSRLRGYAALRGTPRGERLSAMKRFAFPPADVVRGRLGGDRSRLSVALAYPARWARLLWRLVTTLPRYLWLRLRSRGG